MLETFSLDASDAVNFVKAAKSLWNSGDIAYGVRQTRHTIITRVEQRKKKVGTQRSTNREKNSLILLTVRLLLDIDTALFVVRN